MPEGRNLHFLRSFMAVVWCAVLLTGCETSQKTVINGKPSEIETPSSEKPSSKKIQTKLNILVEARAIPATSALSDLAEALDKVAVERSVPLQNVRAAEAERAAAKFTRYPKILPTASAPLSGGAASFGVNVEQTIWDGGRTRGTLAEADLNVSEARVDTWQDRNQVIYEGLSAFIGIQRYKSRIEAYKALEQDLSKLNVILGDRISGGVADRGEQLRMSLSLQEVQRDIVSDQSDLRAEEATLARLVSQKIWPKAGARLLEQNGLCSRDWPKHEVPDVAKARVRVMRAENEKNIAMARRFPRIVAGAGSTYTDGSFSKPAIALSLDASDMFGLGRKRLIEAVEAGLSGALRSYELQKSDTDAELEKLDQDYKGYMSDIQQLKALQKTNSENITLYREQVMAGTIPLAEGITLFRESTNTDIDLIDARARALDNCLEAANIRGALAPFGISHE